LLIIATFQAQCYPSFPKGTFRLYRPRPETSNNYVTRGNVDGSPHRSVVSGRSPLNNINFNECHVLITPRLIANYYQRRESDVRDTAMRVRAIIIGVAVVGIADDGNDGERDIHTRARVLDDGGVGESRGTPLGPQPPGENDG